MAPGSLDPFHLQKNGGSFKGWGKLIQECLRATTIVLGIHVIPKALEIKPRLHVCKAKQALSPFNYGPVICTYAYILHIYMYI